MFGEVSSPSLWVCWALTSVVVAVAGPFGTFATQPIVWRLMYWSSLIALAIVIAIFLRAFWRSVLPDLSKLKEDFAVAGSLAFVFGPVVICINHVLAGAEARAALGPGMVVVCTFAIAVGTIAMRRVLAQPDGDEGQSKTVTQDRLLGRIEAGADARLSRISSDNHHIKIVLNNGEEHRLLMRLRDALEETDVEPGVVVHRSHWVAKDAVLGVKKTGNRSVVVLRCGAEVPVGPTYRDNLDFVEQISG